MSIPSKISKSANNQAKSTVNTSISNGMNFCCTAIDLSYQDKDKLIIPTQDNIKQWFRELFKSVITYKPLHPKAVENYKKNNKKPPKQTGEVYVFIVTSSDTHIHIGINIPNNEDLDTELFKTEVTSNYDTVENYDNIYSIQHQSPFKERDNIIMKIFSYLKKKGLFIEEYDDNDDDTKYFNLEFD